MSERNDTRDRILTHACAVFLQKGLFNTLMEDIAEACELSRRTLYRYFGTKEELAYETVITLLRRWNQSQRDIYQQLHGTGIEKLEAFLSALVSEMQNHTPVMRFMGEFDFYFQDSSHYQPPEALAQRFLYETGYSDQLLLSILHQGVQDNTITLSQSAERTEITISNLLWAFGQRAAIRTERIRQEFGLSPMDIISTQISLYIQALKK